MAMFPSTHQEDSLESYFRASVHKQSAHDEMRYEWLRLKSFLTFPLTSRSHSPVRLARSGFYFTGQDQECVCFSCGVHNFDWSEANVTEIHRRLCPDCRHLNGCDVTNIPIGSNGSCNACGCSSEATDTRKENKASGEQRKVENENRSKNTTRSQHEGPIQNQQPSNSRSNHLTANVTENNANTATRQPSTQNQQSPNARSHHLREMLEPLGIVFERPKYPSYSVLATRISSYQQWPSHLTQTPRDLSVAGFFYAGYGDCVRCFFCGGGLQNWEAGDDAWVEHAKWFSKCPFVLQNRGENFVTLVQTVENDQSEASSLANPSASLNIEEFPAAKQIHEMGYSWEKIKATYSRLENSESLTVEDLMEIILDNEISTPIPSEMRNDENAGSSNHNRSMSLGEGDDPGRTTTSFSEENTRQLSDFESMSLKDETQLLLDENRRLKEQRLCKICMEEDISIAFLPCAHLCCCTICAPAMRKCPICRAFIKGTVKTYPA